MARFHGLGAIDTRPAGGGSFDPVATHPNPAGYPTGGGGPTYVQTPGLITPAAFSVQQVQTAPVVVTTQLTPSGGTMPATQPAQGGVVVGDPIQCGDGQSFDPTIGACVSTTPPTGSTTTTIPPSGCPSGYVLDPSVGQCVPLAAVAPLGFQVPTWGWVAGLGIAGYLAYHFLIAK